MIKIPEIQLVIDWERIAKAAGRFSLLLLEYSIKLSAIAVTAVALAAQGSFLTKLGTGFGSISIALRNIFTAPAEIYEAANLIHKYNTMSAAAFNEQFGADAINGVLAYLNVGIVYLQTVYQNFANQPFSTFFAAFIAFFILYLISLVLRFARQKGQGSFLNRLERKLSGHVFDTYDLQGNRVTEKNLKPKHTSQGKGFRQFGNSQKPNEYLKNYSRTTRDSRI
jgi:hypothetical protein